MIISVNKVPFLLLFAASHLLILNNSFSQAPKKIKTIIVDAGHGGSKDPGATGNMKIHCGQKKKI